MGFQHSFSLTTLQALGLEEAYYNLQNERLVFPSLEDGVTVISANADWTYGAYAEVVPANTITSAFHVLAVSIEDCDENAVFQLELYKGADDEVIQAARFAVEGGFFGNQVYVIGSKEVDANARVRARLASGNGTAAIATAVISIVYYPHP